MQTEARAPRLPRANDGAVEKKKNPKINEERERQEKIQEENQKPSKYFQKRRVKKKSAKSINQSSGNVAVRSSVRTCAWSGDVSGLCAVLQAAAAGAGVGFQSPKPPAHFPI